VDGIVRARIFSVFSNGDFFIHADLISWALRWLIFEKEMIVIYNMGT
jgi:hypothetical protein